MCFINFGINMHSPMDTRVGECGNVIVMNVCVTHRATGVVAGPLVAQHFFWLVCLRRYKVWWGVIYAISLVRQCPKRESWHGLFNDTKMSIQLDPFPELVVKT